MSVAASVAEVAASLDRLADSLVASLDAAIERALDEQEARFRAITPVGRPDRRYGRHMREEYYIARLGPGHFEFGNESPHGQIPFTGSAPHPIDAREAPFLVFEGRDGGLVFRRHVDHPGTRPDEDLLAALDDAEAAIDASVRASLDRIAL